MTYDNPNSAEPTLRRWLTEAETAARLNLSAKWLQTQRLRGGGLRFAKFGAAVRYAVADIEEFERVSLRSSTSDPGPDGIQRQRGCKDAQRCS
jgi:hypothetical protein